MTFCLWPCFLYNGQRDLFLQFFKGRLTEDGSVDLSFTDVFVAHSKSWLLPDLLASGKESYCVCTLQVALGFLREVQVHGGAAPAGPAVEVA